MDTERAVVPGVRDALVAACPVLREADADLDSVCGVTPAFVASPGSTQEAAALLRAAAAFDLAVIPRGAGTGLGWGLPPTACDLVVDMTAMDQVLEHAAGDLVTRVQAGVTMGQLASVLASAGQELALDVPAEATVGGVVATGTAGPRRLRYGAPRDLLIGITIVRADGTVAHSGGKVVKNVAGYDLGKLFAGSFGTLGLIVEAVFRLHPRPAAATYVTLDCPDAAAAYQAVAAASASVLAPSAIEIDRPARDWAITVGVLLEGEPTGVSARTAAMRDLLAAQPGARPDAGSSPPAWWGWPAEGGGWPGGSPGNTSQPESLRQPATAAPPGQPGDGASPGRRDGQDVPGGPAPASGAAGQTSGSAAASSARPEGTLVRVAFWAAALPRVLDVIDAAARSAGLDPAVGGSAAAGVMYAAAAPGTDPAAVAAFVTALRAAFARGEGDAPAAAAAPAKGEGEVGGPPVMASAVIVHAPPAVRDLVDLW